MTQGAKVALDLYCGVGGASRGYQLAGLAVHGVDVRSQPNYCGEKFTQADALTYLREAIRTSEIRRYVLVHASPPCQERCAMTVGTNRSRGWGGEHEQLVPATRRLLEDAGVPYVIEQPTGHGGLIRTDLRLCADMFRSGPPPWVMRHRDFELAGFSVEQPAHPGGRWNSHEGRVRGMRHGEIFDGPYVAAYGNGGGKATEDEMRHALGIPWARCRRELTEAIPPAYTQFIATSVCFPKPGDSVGEVGVES